MNKNILWLIVVIVVVGAISFFVVQVAGGATPTSSAVQISEQLQVLVTALLMALLTAGFAWLSEVLGFELGHLAAPIAMALSALLIALAQGWINQAPVELDPVIEMALRILEVILGGLGALRIAQKIANRPTLL